MTRTIDSYLDRDPIFPMAASIASKILHEEYDVLTLVYNHYENQVKFHTVYKKIPNFTAGGMPEAFKRYEVRGAPRARGWLAALLAFVLPPAAAHASTASVCCTFVPRFPPTRRAAQAGPGDVSNNVNNL